MPKRTTGYIIGVDQKLKHKAERALKHTSMETERKKSTYEEMEQHFVPHQSATSETDDSTLSRQSSGGGDDNEMSSVIVQ